MTNSKEILDNYATIVVPKNLTSYDKQTGKGKVFAKWKTEKELYQYGTTQPYSEELVLWIPPEDSVVIEFEGARKENDKWIEETTLRCDELNIEYCVCDHNGKSKYVWIFNIEELKEHETRKAFAQYLIPKEAILDYTNLGRTFVPIIGHKHWKHNTIHKIVKGIFPLEQQNTIPKKVFENIDKIKKIQIAKTLQKNSSDKLNKIITKDRFVNKLLRGDISKFSSPSEARMSLYFCLVGYGLTDNEIHSIMSQSTGLNYAEKIHVQQMELEKARLYSTRARTL